MSGVLQPLRETHQLHETVETPEARVTSEPLVAAVAGESADNPSVADGPGDSIGRDEARVRERLVEMPQEIEHSVRREGLIGEIDHLMLRAAVLRHGDGGGRLIVARIRKADVERADGAAVRAAVSGNDEGRVDAAAQECC